MCGLHCLNSLLQGPHFDEVKISLILKVELSKIALKLDDEEYKLMIEGEINMADLKKF